jgi:hypothetical protein
MAEENKGGTISLEIKNPGLFIFLAFAILILFLEISLATNRPIAFGDGAYHAYISKYIGQNKIFPNVLPGLDSYYTYSPLLHLMLSVFYTFQNGEVFAKAFIPISVFITGLAIFTTVSKYISKKAGFVAAVLTITLPIVVTYSVVIYTDILMLLFFGLSGIFALIADKENSRKYWILAVVFGGLSFLAKGIGLMSYGFIACLLIYKFIKKEFQLKEFLKLALILSVVALVISGGWILRNLLLFKAIDCNLPLPKLNCVKETIDPSISTKFEGYVTPSGSNLSVLSFGLKNFAEFMYGNVWIVPLAAMIGVILILAKREKVDYFTILLLILAIFPAIVISIMGVIEGSEQRTEDIARYMILSAFVIPLIASVFFDKLMNLIKKYWRFLPVIIVALIMIFSWFSFKSKLDTMSSVTQFSPAFFQACDFIKGNTEKDSRFLSLWAAPTVYNCERNARWESDYLPDIVLSKNVSIALNATKYAGIDYIFIQKFALSSVAYQASVPISFVQFLEANKDHFQNIYENGPKLEDCISQGGCDGSIVYKIIY